MWHRLKDVARSRRFPEEIFEIWSLKRHEKYSIIVEDKIVSTWHVDNLIDDFNREWNESLSPLGNNSD